MTDFLPYLTLDLQSSAPGPQKVADLLGYPFSLSPVVLLLAFLLDMTIGDPRWLPHPVRGIGTAISKTEEFLRKYFKASHGKGESINREKFGGILLVLIIVVSVFWIVFFIQKIFSSITASSYVSTTPLLQYSVNILVVIFIVYLTSTTIATRELINSSKIVIEAVKDKDLESARKNLGMIVGRDTNSLSEKGILRATIETLSENLSDGIIAPLFYLATGGLPLAMTYKAINTLDSMVGYKNKRYKNFGWASARLDDIANYIPARITGVLIVASVFILTLFKDIRYSLLVTRCSFKTMLLDGKKHTSPNAGIPEAAMAGALGIILGGPSTYGGVIVEKPYIGVERQKSEKLYLEAVEKAINIVKAASILGLGIAVVVLYVRNPL